MSDFDDPADGGSAGHSWRRGQGEFLPPSQRRRARFFGHKRFIFLVACLVIVSLTVAIPDMATALLMVTFGLAFPLVFAPTALLYLVAGGVPYLYATSNLETFDGPLRWARIAGGVAFAGLCAALVAFAPNLLSVEKARSIEGGLAARNVAINIDGAARRIAITARDPATWETTPPIESRICGDECRALLLSGAADWIKIAVPPSQHKNANAVEGTTFVTAEGADCLAAEDLRKNPIHCVLVAPPRAGAPELDIVATHIAASRDKPTSPLTPIPGASRRLTARQGGRQVFERLQQDVSIIGAPTIVAPAFQGINSAGFEIARAQQTLNAVTLKEMFVALGYGAAMKTTDGLSSGLTKFSDPPTAEQLNRAVSTLALPSEIAFNSAHLRFIDEWVSQVRWRKPFQPDDIALLRKVLLEPRITHVGFIDQALARPEALSVLAPDMIELLATRKIGSNLDPVRQASYVLRRANPETLQPFRREIERAAQNTGALANPKEMGELLQRLNAADKPAP